MIRTFLALSLAAILISAVSGAFIALQPGAVVVGGHYHIGPNQTLREDVSFYFAQVTIDEGAAVDGQVFLFSSTLNLRGHVTEDIRAIESDLTLQETAQVHGEIDGTDFIHWTLLLPAIAQVP